MSALHPQLEEFLRKSNENDLFEVLIVIQEGKSIPPLGTEKIYVLSPNILSVSLTSKQILSLSEHPDILSIESNSEVHAL